jgi:hypothetical protein
VCLRHRLRRAPVAGGLCELRMRAQDFGVLDQPLTTAKAWTGGARSTRALRLRVRPDHTGPRSHTPAAVTVLVSVGPDWVRPMGDVLVIMRKSPLFLPQVLRKSAFLPELKNRANLPQLLKPCVLPSWPGYKRFRRRFCLFFFIYFS